MREQDVLNPQHCYESTASGPQKHGFLGLSSESMVYARGFSECIMKRLVHFRLRKRLISMQMTPVLSCCCLPFLQGAYGPV